MFDTKLDRLLCPRPNDDGYMVLTLTRDDGKRKGVSIHRLMGLAFIPNPDNKPTVNHEDGIKSNNFISNLKWATRSEQTQHAWDNNLIRDMTSRREAIRTHEGKRVTCITTGETFRSIGEAAERYGLQKTNISAVCHHKPEFKTAGKTPDGIPMEWRFTDET